MGPWHSGRISIQQWKTQRLSEVWRRSKESRPALWTGSQTGLCDISIGYWLRGTALWAPSPSRLHSVTPSFQLLICGTLDLNILPFTLAAITFRRGPLHQTAAMTTGILTTQEEGGNQCTNPHWCFCVWICVYIHMHLLLHTVCLNLSFSITLHPPLLICYVTLKHIHHCFSLHPDTDMVHCSINISRVANYERFLLKRLYGFSKQLFNCSTQPYQHKSRRPWRGEKQGSADNKTTRQEFYTVKVKFLFILCADVDWDNLCVEKETVTLMNLLIGYLIGCS